MHRRRRDPASEGGVIVRADRPVLFVEAFESVDVPDELVRPAGAAPNDPAVLNRYLHDRRRSEPHGARSPWRRGGCLQGWIGGGADHRTCRDVASRVSEPGEDHLVSGVRQRNRRTRRDRLPRVVVEGRVGPDLQFRRVGWRRHVDHDGVRRLVRRFGADTQRPVPGDRRGGARRTARVPGRGLGGVRTRGNQQQRNAHGRGRPNP